MKRTPIELEAVIEIPMGSSNKYEVSKEDNKIKLNRVLFSAVNYPAEYGFIDNTLAEDGDPLDVLVLVTNPTFPGCIINCRVLGYLDMYDGDDHDQKLIAVPTTDPRFSHYSSIKDIGPHHLKEIEYFFKTYKDLQGEKTKVVGWRGRTSAEQLIKECFERYSE